MIIYGNEIDSDKSTVGNMIGTNSLLNRQEYPDNGISGNYWYVYDRNETSYSQDSYIEDVYSTNSSAYPANGKHTDGYWYNKTVKDIPSPIFRRGDILFFTI